MGRAVVRGRCALAGLLVCAAWWAVGCTQGPDDEPPSLSLHIVRSSRAARDTTAPRADGVGTTARKRQTERVLAAVLDASDQTLAGIPLSAAYTNLVTDYGSQRLALTTWPQWRSLLARHYAILDEQELVVEGNTASGTLGAAFGWNLVAVAFLDSVTVTWVGIGPGNAMPGGSGTAVVRVEPPVGYQLPGTGPLQVVISSPTDDEIITTPVAGVRGYLNDPFLESGSLQLDEGTAQPIPLLTGFFAVPVPVTLGVHQVTVQVERARTKELASATRTFFYQLPLGISISLPPDPAVTTQAAVDVRGQLGDSSPVDSIVVYVNDVRATGAWQEGQDFGSSLPVPLQRGANAVRAIAYRRAEVASDQATLTRRDPLYVRVLEIGGSNNFFEDCNLGSLDTNLDAPSPTFTLEGSLPADSRLRLRWRNLTSPGSGSIAVTDPATGGLIESRFHAAGAFFQDDLPLPVLQAGRHTFFIIYHNDQQSFGAAEIDQMILYVGNAADGEVFTFGAVDDSGADLNWGQLGFLGPGTTVASRQALTFRGEFGNDRWGAVRWNPEVNGPATGEGIDLFVDGNNDFRTFSAGIPGPNAFYVDDILVPNLQYYGQHTLELAVRPAADATAGVLIDGVSFQFDSPPVGSGAAAHALPAWRAAPTTPTPGARPPRAER